MSVLRTLADRMSALHFQYRHDAPAELKNELTLLKSRFSAAMNVMVKSSKIRLRLQWGFCLAVLTIFSPVLHARPQGTAQTRDFLPPPRANLLPVHWPDLTRLEPEVRDQLESLQTALAATAKNPKTTGAALSEAYGILGESYQVYSLNSAARECYLNATSLTPQDFRWVYLLARMDQQEDLIADAIRRYRIARTLQPEYVAVPVNLGNIYLQRNRLAEANENFTTALLIDKSSAAALYGLGQIALSQRNYTAAVNYFEKALTLIPGANRIHYSLAMAYRGLGDPEKATAHLAQQGTVGVRVNDPLVDSLQQLIKGERIHLVRGKLALESQRYTEAIEEFRQAIRANRDSLPAHVNLGAALSQTGDLPGAAEHFEEALRIDPQNTNAHYNLAIVLAKQNQHGPAIPHLQFILRVDPKDLSARFFLAGELLRSERLEEALVEFSRVAEADPNNEDAVIEQVRLLQQKQQSEEALERLKKAHAQYPQKERTAVMLAWLLAASPQYGLRDGARSLELAQAIYQASGSSEHGALVAMALAELGRCAEAAQWQRRMIAAAEQERKTDLLAQLNKDLKLYEQGQPCRPAGEAVGKANPNQ
jgi:tetratricopeptide (TPR) repeat protein